jgi:hypothetical protein
MFDAAKKGAAGAGQVAAGTLGGGPLFPELGPTRRRRRRRRRRSAPRRRITRRRARRSYNRRGDARDDAGRWTSGFRAGPYPHRGHAHRRDVAPEYHRKRRRRRRRGGRVSFTTKDGRRVSFTAR